MSDPRSSARFKGHFSGQTELVQAQRVQNRKGQHSSHMSDSLVAESFVVMMIPNMNTHVIQGSAQFSHANAKKASRILDASYCTSIQRSSLALIN